MRGVSNLIVICLVGVILADLVNNIGGTNTLLSGIGSIWQTSVNGMLGQATTGTGTTSASTQQKVQTI